MIVVDTNQLGWLNVPGGAPFAILRQVAQQRGHALAVPEMVLIETLAHYRHGVEEDIAAIEKGQRGLRSRGANIRAELPNVDTMVRLREEELRKHFTVLLPAEGAAWEALQREAQRRRPADVDWKKKGAGARDSLIWLTILAAVQQPGAEPVILVTADTDFGKGQQLHPELREELREAGVEADRVKVYASITVVLNELAEKADVPADLDEVLNSPQAAQAVSAALQPNAGAHLWWLFRNHQYSGPGTVVMAAPPVEDLVPGLSGRTESYLIEGKTWVSAERPWTGTYRVALSLEPADAAVFRQPSFDVPFEVDVTVLVGPEEDGNAERVQVINYGMLRTLESLSLTI